MVAPAGLTLPELRAHLNLDPTDTGNDDELWFMLTAAGATVEQRVGAMEVRTVQSRVTVGGYPTVRLPQEPIISVTSVTNAATGVAVPAPNLDTLTGSLTWAPMIPGGYDVTYVVGREPVPPDLMLATLIVARQLWDTQRNAAPLGFTSMAGQEIQIPMGFAIPRRAAELMAPHRLLTVA